MSVVSKRKRNTGQRDANEPPQCFQARVLITFSLYYVTTNSKSHPHWKTAGITKRKKVFIRFVTTPLVLILRPVSNVELYMCRI